MQPTATDKRLVEVVDDDQRKDGHEDLQGLWRQGHADDAQHPDNEIEDQRQDEDVDQ